jgi:hypothetical protein
MFATPIDLAAAAVVIAGALVAGFVTGLAGFATALGSGLWFHALPAAAIPPLVALGSLAAQIVGVITVQKALDWSRASPYLAGGALGVHSVRSHWRRLPRSCSEHPWAYFSSSMRSANCCGAASANLAPGRHVCRCHHGVSAAAFSALFAGLSGPLPLSGCNFEAESRIVNVPSANTSIASS